MKLINILRCMHKSFLYRYINFQTFLTMCIKGLYAVLQVKIRKFLYIFYLEELYFMYYRETFQLRRYSQLSPLTTFCGNDCNAEPGYLKWRDQKDLVRIWVYSVLNRSNWWKFGHFFFIKFTIFITK